MTAKPLRIAIIEPFREGAMLQIGHKLAESLEERGHQVTLHAAERSEIDGLNRRYRLAPAFDLRRKDRQLVGTTSPLGRSYWYALRALLAVGFVAQYLRVVVRIALNRSDVVVVSTVFRYPLISQMLRIPQLAGAQIVQLCHEFELREENPTLPDRVLRRVNRNAYRRFDQVVMLSEHQRTRFLAVHPEVDPERVGMLPLPNCEIFQDFRVPGAAQKYLASLGAPPTSQGYLLFVGRIRPDKGVDDLLEAYHHLASQMPEVPSLVLAGHARENYARELRERISALGVGQVHLGADYVPSEAMWDLVRNARLVVLPYRTASQSAVLQLAFTCGVPVIGTSVGGIPEVLEDGRTGRVVTPQAPAELSAAIRESLADPGLIEQWSGEAARESRTTYGWSGFAAGIEELAVPRSG